MVFTHVVINYHGLNLCPIFPPCFPAGTQCQLRGGPFCAGIPVQGARRDGPCDGASATRPHAAVRRQGEHRALYGTLPLNHAHSLCLSDTLSPSSAFIPLSLRGTNSLASVCTTWCQSFWLSLWLSLSSANLKRFLEGQTGQETFVSLRQGVESKKEYPNHDWIASKVYSLCQHLRNVNFPS